MRHLGRHPRIVVDESDNACVEASLRRVMDSIDVFCIAFVGFANPARRPRGGGHPSEAESATGKVPVGENVGEAELLVVGLGVQVEKVGHVDVGYAKWVLVFGRCELEDGAEARLLVAVPAVEVR